MQRERAVIAEAVEGAPARGGTHEVPVLTLIEKRSGLLPRPRRGEKLHSVFVHFDLSDNITVQEHGLTRKAFLGAERDIVSRENSLRLDERSQRGDYLRPERLEPRAHELDDEPRVVAIAHE